MVLNLSGVSNVLWVGIAVLASVWLGLFQVRFRETRPGGLRRAVAVLLAAIVLFPALSDSDDLFSYSLLNSQLNRHGGYGTPVPVNAAGEKASLQLIRVLSSLEQCPTTPIFALVLALFCIACLSMLRLRPHAFAAVRRPGRAPPFA